MGKGRSGGKRKQLARKQGTASRAATKRNRATDLFARAKSHDFSSRTTHNKFDIKDNKRAKHVVLGRKVKGRSRDVSRARALRQTELEANLRPAMHAAHKVNTFLDRRIGEQDDTMDQEEKDLQRFIKAQKERFLGGRKKGSKFNLDGGGDGGGAEEDTLTHGGKSIGELDFGRHRGEDGYGSDDDRLGEDIVNQLHFGGGGGPGNMLGGSGSAGGAGKVAPKKTREEIYRELIAKSKAFKAERQQQKRDDEEEQDRLDDELGELQKLLSFREKKMSKKEEMEAMMKRAGMLPEGGDADAGRSSAEKVQGKLTQKQKRQGLSLEMDDNDDFDSMAKSLLFEARAQASDRTKTVAERAEEERERLEELEAQRLRRARGDFSDEEEDGDAGADDDVDIDGSGAADRGDGLGMNFVLDPAFLGGGAGAGGDDDDDDDVDDDNAEGGGSNDDEYDDEADEEVMQMLLAAAKAKAERGASKADPSSSTVRSSKPTAKAKTRVRKTVDEAVEDMPYILPCPTTVASFIEMVGRYALPSAAPTKVKTMIERINASNSVHLPSKTAGTTNREKIGRLCAIVVHYLVSMGQTNPDLFPPAEHIQAVVSALFALARDVPMAAGEAFRAALHRVFLQCVEGVHPDDEEDRTRLRRRWPTVGELILLRTTMLLFPVTDFRHPVTTPFSLLLGALLAGGFHHSGCGPVRTAGDFAKALFLAELQLDVAKKTKRLAPESVNFCCAAIARLLLDTRSLSAGGPESDAKKLPAKTQKKRRLRAAQATRSAETLTSRVPIFAEGGDSLDFLALCRTALREQKRRSKQRAKEEKKTAKEGENEDEGGEGDQGASSPLAYMPSKLVPLKALLFDPTANGKKKDRALLLPYVSVLTALFALLERASDQFNTNVALPEMFADALPCLRALLRTKHRQAFPDAVEKRAASAVARVVENVAAAVEMRVPCRLQAQTRRAVPIRQQRPMFDENYIVRKDNDPDKERAELKSLKRKIKREQKAVARDLRRDALFVAQEQEKKDRAWEAETQSKYNKAVEFVNQQHAEAKAVQREGVAHGGGMVAGRRFKRSRHAK